MCSAPTLGGLSDSDHEPEEADRAESRALTESEPDTATNSSTDSSHEEEDSGAVAKYEIQFSSFGLTIPFQ